MYIVLLNLEAETKNKETLREYQRYSTSIGSHH